MPLKTLSKGTQHDSTFCLDMPAAGKLGLGRISGVPEPLRTARGHVPLRISLIRDMLNRICRRPYACWICSLVMGQDSTMTESMASISLKQILTGTGLTWPVDSPRGTRGLLNINTASVESLRALPNWYKSLGVDAYTGAYSSVAERFPVTGWPKQPRLTDGISNLTATHGMPLSRTFFICVTPSIPFGIHSGSRRSVNPPRF